MTHPSVKVQIVPESVPSTPSWFGEVAVLAHVLTQFGILGAIQQGVQFARARFGHYDTIDFVVVLIGYAVSGEPTLKAFYERLWPFAPTFMALFGRSDLPCTRINGWAPFSGPGNGDYRGELRQALQAITAYAAAFALPLAHVIVRVDGLYGNTAPLHEILSSQCGVIGRSKE